MSRIPRWLLEIERYSPMAEDSIYYTEKFDTKDEAVEFFIAELRGAPNIGVWLKQLEYDDEGYGYTVDTVDRTCLQSVQYWYGDYNYDEPDERMGFEKDLDALDAAVNNYN